ncbi:sigma-70 family RNA polymerase sigma factor [Rhizobiales bacterium Sp-1]|uniref:RNA polymerase sigma factor n=2 Tax=Segnochrobactrum spirostomi TaxID=2608987 RepID=A0A6A7Y8Z3_9HYPH|nr:sigma-70 family RNA polymerase sigma factor [Segnochrobactrum spirostomi]
MASGDPQAATALRQDIIGMIPALRAFARALTRNNPSDADDLVQETLLKAIANAHRFEPGTSLRAWLFTILRNTYYTSMRVRRREVADETGDIVAGWSVAPAQEWALRGHEARRALEQLSDDQREVIVLVAVLGMSYEDAAVVCACATGTIKSRLNRARNRMLELLEADSIEEVFSGNEAPGTAVA